MGDGELKPGDINEAIGPFRAAVAKTWSAFCASTSIHGLKYVKDEETNRAVRIIWFFISVIMFICAIIMVDTFYLDYLSNPTRMNVENDHAPISSLYFPSVTICPDVPFNTLKARKFFGKLKLPGRATVEDAIEGLTSFQGFMVGDETYKEPELELMEEILTINKLSLNDLIANIHWNCNDLLLKCRFRREEINCDHLFQLSQTYSGQCCSFNIQQPGVKFTEKYARAGISEGLSIMLGYGVDLTERLHSYSYGFRLLIQEHYAYPSAHANIKFITLNEETFIAVRPIETFCSDAVRNMNAEERLCVFPEEISLRYFPAFIPPNCELDCRIGNMITFCGCMTYFFNFNRTQDRICTFKDIPCLIKNFADIIGRFRKTQCSCPSPCESIDYEVQSTNAIMDMSIPTVDKFYNGLKKDYAVVHVFMNAEVYRRVRHDLLSNTVVLVSNLGSAFSLFIGMSMVSAVEILYYFTVILHKFYRQEKNARANLLFKKKSLADSRKKELY